MRAWTSAASGSASSAPARRLSQSIPIIARQAAHLYAFQRTPNYTIPAHNGPLDPAYQAAVKADYAGLRACAKTTFPGLDFNFNMEFGAGRRRGEAPARVRDTLGLRRPSLPSAPNQTDGSLPIGSMPLSGLSSQGWAELCD